MSSTDSVNAKSKKPKPKTMTCGFTDEGFYFESAFTEDSEPTFLVCSNPSFEIHESVLVKDKKVVGRTERQTFETMPFIIYDFDNAKSKEELFQKIYAEVDAYIDAPREYKILLALAIMLSFEQEKFNWLPYLGVFGDVESGKSVLGELFATLCYRGQIFTSSPSADIYEFLTQYKDTIPIFVEDEIQGLERDSEKAKIYKSGNSKNACVPRILKTEHGRKLIQYSVFGLKMLLGEQEPNLKGLLRRIIKIPMSKGNPQKKWYERTEEDNIRLRKLKQDLLKWAMNRKNERYDLTKYPSKSGFEDNLKPFLLLSEDLSIAQEFQTFCNSLLQQFQESKKETFEGVLVETVHSLILKGFFINEQVTQTVKIKNNLIWQELPSHCSVEPIPYHNEKVATSEFGEITKSKVSRTLKDIFDAKTVNIRENETTFRGIRIEWLRLEGAFSNYLESDELEVIKQKLKGDSNAL